MSQVVVGGTFNVFHKGHAKLLDAAMTIASFKNAALVIGVTSDELAQSSRSVPVRPYRARLDDVARYVERSDIRPEFGPVMYSTIYDVSDLPVMDERDTLVVSEETEGRARSLLAKKGYICKVRTVPMVMDSNGEEMHSTKILEEEK